MGGGATDKCQSSTGRRPDQPILESRHIQEVASPSLPIPDELLEDIFLRLPTPADLVRASATCVSFRRVTADCSFVRRFRKLHDPPLLGFLDRCMVFHPVVAPHRTAIDASAFDFSFLPVPASCWIVRDVRDGRILLDSNLLREHTVFKDMVVCDPLHRRYLLLPKIPDKLRASVEDPRPLAMGRWCDNFLVPPNDQDEEIAWMSFRVIFMAQCKSKLFTFIFSSSTGQWRAVPPQSLSDLFPDLLGPEQVLDSRQYAYGCFYWIKKLNREIKMLVLDTRRMEFCIVKTPPEAKARHAEDITMVEAGEGRPGMFVLAHGRTYDLSYYSIRTNNGGSFSQWQCEKTISLGSWCLLIGSMKRCLLLYQGCSSSSEPGCYTLDIQTFQLEKVCHVTHQCGFLKLYAYINFPPSLFSLPTISSGVENEDD
ncbi:uncharacterized protein [Triticum aestivum]|uniref:uncharacterized protein n=1 Tax=Triticum aestivum TaxID=4565 RepID=UPI0008423A95|nr:uncharacterized protein LOC123133357 [Triticum aestivum]